MKTKMPTLFIPHGAGPCFFMDWTMGPKESWGKLESWLRAMGTTISAIRFGSE